jgi:hypothetical protein
MGHASRCRNGVLLAGLLAIPGTALAVEPLDRGSFSIGSYLTRFDTEVRVDGQFTSGSSVDLGRDLGLDPDDTIAFAKLSWRPFDRHEFGVSYFSNDVAADHRLDRDFVFEDTVYQAAATVRARYDVDSLEAHYVWWGFSEEDWALGPRLGVTVYRIELGVELALDVNGQPIGSGGVEDSFNGDLPAPTIGASWRWTPGEDWRISADAGWLSTTINNIEGTVGYARVGVEWHPWQHAGLMLDYNVMDIRASTERRHFTGHLDMRNSGLRMGVVFRY